MKFKLCYIDSIPQTVMDYTEKSKRIKESNDYKRWRKERDAYAEQLLKEYGSYSYSDLPPIPFEFELEYDNYPNEEFIEGKQEFYAYFTNLDNLSDQWGDDWDDSPYEYNAETPYDSKNGVEHIILKVPFYVNHDGYYVKFPYDYQCMGNSHFCVRDINAKAVAWIFAKGMKGKSSDGSVSVLAGISPEEFYDKVTEINKLYPFSK